MEKKYFDIAVVIPLEEEMDEFIKIFDLKDDYSTKDLLRYSVDSGNCNINLLMIKQESMGKSCARDAATSALHDFDVGVIICLGIAGCLTDDMQLGDVCYSSKIFDVLDNAKTLDIEQGVLGIEFSPTHYNTDKVLVAALSFMRQKKDLRPIYEVWQQERAKIAENLAPEIVVGRNGREEKLGAPRTKEGTVACASVTKSEEYNRRLKTVDRKVLAVETESSGIYEAAKAKGVPAITIRGISDHADDFKNKLESGTSGNIRKIAASNAASFLKLQINNPEFIDFLDIRKKTVLSIDDKIESRSPIYKRSRSEIVSSAVAAIDEKLRDLCPEFKLQQKGYRLPIPRVRQTQDSGAIVESPRGSPINLSEALEIHSAILLSLPRTYPDHSLPWVIANDLLTAEVAGRQLLPVVIDGAYLKVPNAGFKILASHSVDDVDPADGIQVVYIIDNIPISSKSRMSFLRKEIDNIRDAKFIFISHEEDQIVDMTEFANQQKASTFTLCPISFYEITHFVQKNYSMSGSEAEVVALRLRDTFEQFDLSAHPTYFAGIPKEVLSALLQANRRSELIQLAVDGFLTFIVADDRSDITLSRTTRSRFLRNLAIEINVDKNKFDLPELIKFTSKFSELFDFAIDSLKFIQSFLDKGILHFGSDGYIRFSLAFIESYLLAHELHKKPEIAMLYFDFNSDKFDYYTFDIYSEIGAADELVDKYMRCLQECIDASRLSDGQKHILLTEKVRPAMLDHPFRMQALQRRLRKAVDDVQNNRGDTKEKQKIIDVAEYVRETASKQSNLDIIQFEESDQEKNLTQLIDRIGRVWTIGVVLLGSGAEHLVAKTKQELSVRLVNLGSLIIHHWTELRMYIDYKAVKESLQSDNNIENINRMLETNGKDLNDLRRLVGLVFDMFQFNVLSDPFRRVTGYICENARQRVLATSVEKGKFTDPMEKILHSAWLADIESWRGKRALYDAIRELPASQFLRTNLASHFLTRVHWNHWRKEDRLILLDAAEEAIKPLSTTFDKGELKRAIEKSPTPSISTGARVDGDGDID